MNIQAKDERLKIACAALQLILDFDSYDAEMMQVEAAYALSEIQRLTYLSGDCQPKLPVIRRDLA